MAINAQDVKLLREQTGAGIMDCKKALIENDGDFNKAIKYLREKGLADAKKRVSREAKDGKITVAYSEDRKTVLMVEVNCETDFVSRTKEYEAFVEDIATTLLENGVDSMERVPDEIQKKVKNAVAKFGENIVLKKIARFEKEDSERINFASYIHMGGKVGVIVEFLFDGKDLAQNSAVREFEKNVVLQVASMDPLSVSQDDFPKVLLEEQREIFMKQAKESGKPEHILEKIVNGKLAKFFTEACLLEQKYVKDNNLTIKKYLQQIEERVNGHIEIKRFARFKLGEG